MLYPRAVPLLASCVIAASAQTPSSPSMPGPFPASQQRGEATLSCGFCAAPAEPGALDGTNRTVIDKAIRSLGSKVLPGVAPEQTPPSRGFVPDPKLMRRSLPESSRPLNEKIVITRNSPCSMPLVRVPIDPNADPLMVLRPLAPTAPMPQVQVPAPPCDERAGHDARFVIPSRR